MPAMTLVQGSDLNHTGDVLRNEIIRIFASKSNILAALPFETIPGGVLKYDQQGALPGIAFRGYNEAFTASAGVLNPKSDGTYIIGGEIDVDTAILATRGEGVLAAHVDMKLASMADTWAQKFIKGDNTSEPREFDGLQVRAVGTQLLAAGATASGDAMSMAKLDELIDMTENPTALLMNKAQVRNIKVYLRTSTMISEAEDAFGRKLTTYSGIPILVTQNGATEALPYTEACPGGGNSVGTSVYCVSMGQNRLQGIQVNDPIVKDLGEIDASPVRRIRFQWQAGLGVLHPRSIARLWGITNATAVA